MPWQGPQSDITGAFKSLTTSYREDYEAIYALLTDEDATGQAVDRLADALDLGSIESFQKTLRELEIQYDFTAEVKNTKKEYAPDVFLGYVHTGRPINDVTFLNKKHGSSTHRVQWMMIALWNAKAQVLQNAVADLYKGLGASSAQGGSGNGMYVASPYLWDRLVDSEFRTNGTSPEYLHDTFIKNRNDKLYQVML
jgi:hypothetical protein